VYVHLFGALFGLAVSKMLHFKGVSSSKQAPVYHSDLFSLIGTLFLWVYYPSFNGLLAHSTLSQSKAIVNTLAAICASCVVTFGISSLAGRGKLNVLHVQHATIAGGIAIGSVVDLNVQIYVALIVGSIAGFLSTIGYQYIDVIYNIYRNFTIIRYN
jgi:ammonium transporter Rh